MMSGLLNCMRPFFFLSISSVFTAILSQQGELGLGFNAKFSEYLNVFANISLPVPNQVWLCHLCAHTFSQISSE